MKFLVNVQPRPSSHADAVVSWISEPHTWTPPVGVKQARKRRVVAGWRPVAVVMRFW